MAQDFRNVLKSATGTTPVIVLAAGDYDAVIGIRCCNIVATTILVDVYINNSSDFYLAKNVSIPPNSAIELIQGGAKVVLKNGDTLYVKSDTASSVDTVLSYIDTISS